MNNQKFIEQLADLKESSKFYDFTALEEQDLFSLNRQTKTLIQVLNLAVGCLEEKEVYCQWGLGKGGELIGALINHPDSMGYGIDTFSQQDSTGKMLEKIQANISYFGLETQVFIGDQDLGEFIFNLREWGSEDKIGIFFIQGELDYRSLLLGLLLVQPWLASSALIFIENPAQEIAKQACLDWIISHPQCKFLEDSQFKQSQEKVEDLLILTWENSQGFNDHWLRLKSYENVGLIEGIKQGEKNWKEQKKRLNKLLDLAKDLETKEEYKQAENSYQEIVNTAPYEINYWLELGLFYYRTNQYQLALEILTKSLKIDQNKAIIHYNMGVILEKIGEIESAIEAYEITLNLDPNFRDAYNNLGNILSQKGQLEAAKNLYLKAIEIDPNHFGSYLNLGNVLMSAERYDEAIEAYEKALDFKHRDPDILYNLAVAFEKKGDLPQADLHYGYSYYREGKYTEAIQKYQKFLETNIGDPSFYIAFADCYENIEQYEIVIQVYDQGIKHHPDYLRFYYKKLVILQKLDRIEDAVNFLEKVSENSPNYLLFQSEKQRLFPIIYENEAEIEYYRNRFTQNFIPLLSKILLEENLIIGLKLITWTTNFYLQYHGKNDRELQRIYGEFVSKVMETYYPNWVKVKSPRKLQPSQKIRVGYVSYLMRDNTIANLTLGWLRHRDQEKFAIYSYYTGSVIEFYTQLFIKNSDYFYHIPHNLEKLCQQILEDELDILVIFDIGMYASTTQLASLRLAPIQCTTWAHPITSGIPTIDYFLSSELMEPENAQEHYSETLITLPNIGISFEKPTLPQLTKKRSDFVDLNGIFSLRKDSLLYLCCQSLFKYLPQYDYIFPRIAQSVPNSQFIFLYWGSPQLAEKFRKRLQSTFTKFDLNSDNYCIILPRQNFSDYLQLNLHSDIFLDTFAWSGGNTTLEAIACDLPIVTCPGEFMRGRHSYGILKMLGVTDTIANSEEEYIQIAIRLGLDSQWRKSIVDRMKERHHDLYDDQTCVKALEAFYEQIIRRS